eukprot:jgi/Bigna1/139803/aug1.52_g14511
MAPKRPSPIRPTPHHAPKIRRKENSCEGNFVRFHNSPFPRVQSVLVRKISPAQLESSQSSFQRYHYFQPIKEEITRKEDVMTSVTYDTSGRTLCLEKSIRRREMEKRTTKRRRLAKPKQLKVTNFFSPNKGNNLCSDKGNNTYSERVATERVATKRNNERLIQ